MDVGEEVDVEVERIFRLPLAGHDQDQAPSGDPPEVRDRAVDVEDMFQGVRAQDGVERLVREWQPAKPAFDEFEIGHHGQEQRRIPKRGRKQVLSR